MTDVLVRPVPATDLPLVVDASPAPRPPSPLADSVAGDLVLAVAPATGRFRPATTGDERVAAGAVLAHITGGRGRAHAVAVPVAARVRSLLARPGQLVTRGQPLVWLEAVTA